MVSTSTPAVGPGDADSKPALPSTLSMISAQWSGATLTKEEGKTLAIGVALLSVLVGMALVWWKYPGVDEEREIFARV